MKKNLFNMLISILLLAFVGCNNNEPSNNNENGTESSNLDIVSTNKVINFYGTTYEVVLKDGNRMYFNIKNNSEVRMCGHHFYYDDYQPEYEYKGNLIVPEYITLENNKYNVKEVLYLRPLKIETDNTSLISVYVPSSIYRLESAFCACSALKSVTLNEGLVEIDGAFSQCKSLTNIKIPNSVAKFDDSAFRDCINLVDINIPSGIIEFGDDCFNGCVSLNDFEEEELNNIKKIGYRAFKGCEKLTHIKLLNIEDIDLQAFDGCANLKTLVLGANCSIIGSGSFNECNNITDIYCYAITPPKAGFSRLDHINFTLHVPSSAINNYKESSWGWLYDETERNIVPIE